jgi:dihydroorotate dehydrogenase (NAD+) catalytic subunit
MSGNLETSIGPLKLNSPLVAASGTFGYGIEFEGLVDFNAFGAIITKAVSLEPRPGNPYPRIIETPSGMLNTIGLENPGIDVFLNEKLPKAAELGVPIIANLVGDRVEDYRQLAEILDKENRLSGMEINASCPNVECGYETFATTPEAISELTAAVRNETAKPVIAKLSPNVTDIVPIAKAAMDAGADALTLINTFLGMAIDIETRKSRIARDHAGLSGRAIRPLAVRIVHQVYSALKVPIIGTGGIYETSDALEFLIAGASAVSTGTINFMDPSRAVSIRTGISEYLVSHNMDLKDLIGSFIPS